MVEIYRNSLPGRDSTSRTKELTPTSLPQPTRPSACLDKGAADRFRGVWGFCGVGQASLRVALL